MRRVDGKAAAKVSWSVGEMDDTADESWVVSKETWKDGRRAASSGIGEAGGSVA